jgi:small subunit ribosomal protein S16
MLIIRLQRVGKKNQPSYRIVLAEKTYPVQGKFIEILGNYNPRLKTKAFKKERILHWISKGAQKSPTVHNLLVSEKIIEGPKVKAWTPKKKKKIEGEVAPVEAPVSTPAAEKQSVEKTEAPAKEVKEEKTEAVAETTKEEKAVDTE